MTFSKKGKLASSSRDGTIKVWDTATSQLLIQTSTENGSTNVKNLQFSQDGCFLVGACKQYIYVWDVDTGSISRIISTNNPVSTLFVSNQIISGAIDGTVNTWNLYTGELCVSVNIDGAVRAVTCTSDGRILAATVKSTVILFSPDSKTLVCCSTTGIIKLWNFRKSEYIQLGEYGHAVTSIAYSPDGRILACGSKDGILRLWDISTGSCILFSTNIGSIWSLAFSGNGSILAIGADAETVQLWDIRMGRQIYTMKAPRPYEGVKIKGISGLTRTMMENLMQLGAVQ